MEGMGNDIGSFNHDKVEAITTLRELQGYQTVYQWHEFVKNVMEPSDVNIYAPPKSQFDRVTT